MSSLLFLGLATKAGKLESGEEQVLEALGKRKIKLLLLASDAGESVKRHITGAAGETPCIQVPFDNQQLGSMAGRVKCSAAGITDAGFASAFVTKLAAEFPDMAESLPEIPEPPKSEKRPGKRKKTRRN